MIKMLSDQEIIEAIVDLFNSTREINIRKINTLKCLLNSLQDKNSINTIFVDGSPILFHGHSFRNIEINKILLELGADPNFKAEVDLFFYIMDILHSEERLELFLSYGLDPNRNNGEILHFCIYYKKRCSELIQILLKYGANPHIKNSKGLSLIHLACCDKDIDTIDTAKILLPHFSGNKFELSIFEKIISTILKSGSETNVEIIEILKNHIEENIGNDSLKTICINQIEQNNFSFENLPESFYL